MIMVARATKPSHRNRGGCRNYKKPQVDLERLTDSLIKYAKEVGEEEAFVPSVFGEYEGLWASCAIRTRDLAALGPMILAILKVEPPGSLKYGDAKSVFSSIMHRRPE